MVHVRAAGAQVLGAAEIPALEPPNDLRPKTHDIRISLKDAARAAVVVLDPNHDIAEITEANNEISLPKGRLKNRIPQTK